MGNLTTNVNEPALATANFELGCKLCMACPLSWYLRATGLFLNSKDTTGTTVLHSLSLTFTYQVFNISIFPALHYVILIRAPPNDSMVWLSCSFQTVGSSYYRVAATLRTHWGGNKPSVSHVGSNQMRVLTVTISRMKMLFTSGELCPLCLPSHWLVAVQTRNMREYWAERWRQLQWGCEAEAAATPESLLLYFHHRGGINIPMWRHKKENIHSYIHTYTHGVHTYASGVCICACPVFLQSKINGWFLNKSNLINCKTEKKKYLAKWWFGSITDHAEVYCV